MFRSTVRLFHLWLGLSSGLIVFIVSITGSLYVFKAEISDLIYEDEYFIKPQGTANVPLSTLYQNAQRAIGPDFPLSTITTYNDPRRAWAFGTYAYDREAYTYFGQFRSVKTVYMNPYNGDVNGIIDYKYDFFMLVKMLHYSLWLRTDIGKPIVGTATVVVVIMLLSGLILWWRKDRSKQRFSIKWSSSFKRLTFDLHNVLGFYATPVLLLISFTGLVIAFSWMWDLEYSLGNYSGAERGRSKPLLDTALRSRAPVSAMDRAFSLTQKAYPRAASISVYPPGKGDSSLYIYPSASATTLYEFDQLIFSNISGRPQRISYYSNKNNGEKLNAMNYDIHAGSILGFPGKCLAFLAGLIAASLPVTGFILWWTKRRKSLS